MTFSVIIPCYNCAATLEAMVHSIQDSGLTDYELLLIDDGSNDGTGALCDLLCKRYTQIRCIHQQNAGVSAARNRGLEEAQGDYIWFVDADDTVNPCSVTNAVDIVSRQHPDMLIFGMSFDYYHKGKRYRREIFLPPNSGMLSLEQLRKDFRKFYDCNALTSACNKFIRRDLLMAHGVRFRENMILMEDFLFVLDTLPYCRNIYCLNVEIYRYCQSEDERGAYLRLQRITDLAEYMKPFEKSIEKLGIANGGDLADGFYWMLLRQKMQYSELKEICRTVTVHNSGSRVRMELKLDPVKIYLVNLKTQLRHRFAVWVKSTTLYQKRKAANK